MYRSARIRYRLDGPECEIPLPNSSAASETGVNMAGYSETASPGQGRATWGSAQLEIESPHPEGRKGYARAVLRLARDFEAAAESTSLLEKLGVVRSNTSDTRSEGFDAVHVVDVPQSKVDSLVKELEEAGYFEPQTRPHGGAIVETRIGASRIAKRWTSVPAIDRFIASIHGDEATSVSVAGRVSLGAGETSADGQTGHHVIQPDVTESKSGFLRRLRHSVTSPLLGE